MKCITYGHHLSKNRFSSIVQSRRKEIINKPQGGIWSSPVDSERGWKDWCEMESYGLKALKKHTIFEIPDDLKLFKVNTREDYDSLIRTFGKSVDHYPPSHRVIDWEKLQESGYRGLWLTEDGFWSNRETNMGLDFGFYAWDCETVLLFYWEDIKIIEKK